MRIQINLSDRILKRVDEEAELLGTSRGAMLTTWIGEKINNIDQTRAILKDISNPDTIRDMTSFILEQEKKREGKCD